MQVTTNSNSLYTANSSKSSSTKEVEDEYKARHLQATEELLGEEVDNEDKTRHSLSIKELLGEEGEAVLDKFLSNRTSEERYGIKAILSFQLNIKSINVINGVPYIEHETGKLDTKTMLNKLNSLIENRSGGGSMSIMINDAIDALKDYYINKASMNYKDKEDSVVDDFLEDLYSNNSVDYTSTLLKEDMKNKINKYSETLEVDMDDIGKSQMLNEYKQELLKEYTEILESKDEKTPSLKQQGIMKALLDENPKETNLLESLLKM